MQGIIDLEGRRRQRVILSSREGTSERTDKESDAHQSGVPSMGSDVPLSYRSRLLAAQFDHGGYV